MHTETNYPDPDGACDWLWRQAANVRRLRADHVPVVGFTWYGLTDMTDWDVALRERRGTVNPVGLFDLDRRERPVAGAFRRLVRDYGHLQAWDSALDAPRRDRRPGPARRLRSALNRARPSGAEFAWCPPTGRGS